MSFITSKGILLHFRCLPRAYYIILNKARGGVQVNACGGEIFLEFSGGLGSGNRFLVSRGTIWAPMVLGVVLLLWVVVWVWVVVLVPGLRG